jgi:ribosomal-protein-alanine N-acetyltransferase
LGGSADLPAVAAIQRACPEAAQWSVGDYLDQEFLVAIVGNLIVGFLICRTVAPGEREILNLAVAPDFRRHGVARALMRVVLERLDGAVFLEVRESNRIAQEFYKSMSFNAVSRRPNYYDSPPDAAIVMKFHSC